MKVELVLVVVVAAIAVALKPEEVCYDYLGCFSNAPPYGFTKERPISPLPWKPERINTRYLLFTRENPDRFQEISALNISTVSATKFSVQRKSIFIIHGFFEKGEDEWLVDMCRTLLQVSDVNCFCVDWHGGSATLYTQASNNVRVVGAELAYFINYLWDNFRYPFCNTYLIGHSLGAQVAGEAGKRRPKIARITALDPAGPYFENTPPEVRLDPSDAKLVDVIHTNAAFVSLGQGITGFGMSQSTGHLDFFPNGGKNMPGCPTFPRKFGELDNVMKGITKQLLCSPQRSIMYFSQSILHPDGFVSYPGPSYTAFQEGAGFPCCKGRCSMMGYYADAYTQDPGDASTQDPESLLFFLNTGGDSDNLLRWRYQVTVNLTGTTLHKASFSVTLCGKMYCSPQYLIHRGLVQSGISYSSFIDVDMDINPVIKVMFIWRAQAKHVLQPTLGATAMAVQYGPSGTLYHFCGNEVTEEGILQTLESCPM